MEVILTALRFVLQREAEEESSAYRARDRQARRSRSDDRSRRIKRLKAALISAYRFSRLDRAGDADLRLSTLVASTVDNEMQTQKVLWLLTYLCYRWENLPEVEQLVSLFFRYLQPCCPSSYCGSFAARKRTRVDGSVRSLTT